MTICVNPKKGQKIGALEEIGWKGVAPSARVDDRFPDGSVNLKVDNNEADDLIDKLDEQGYDYTII